MAPFIKQWPPHTENKRGILLTSGKDIVEMFLNYYKVCDAQSVRLRAGQTNWNNLSLSCRAGAGKVAKHPSSCFSSPAMYWSSANGAQCTMVLEFLVDGTLYN